MTSPQQPQDTPPIQPVSPAPQQGMTSQQTYNVVSDTVTGPNLRFKDNMIQLAAVVAGGIIGVCVGPLLTRDTGLGLIFGGIGGVLGGLIISGVFIGIYRAVRHAKGKHD